MSTVLVFTRPWWTPLFKQVAEASFQGAKVIWVSEYVDEAREIGGEHLMKGAFQAFTSAKSDRLRIHHIAWESEAIKRDRLLRHLPRHQAEMQLAFVTERWQQIVEKYKPDFALYMGLDNYTGDVFDRVFSKVGIKIVGLCNNYLDGRIRFTSRGEVNRLRDHCPAEDFDRYRKILSDKSYRPAYIRRFNPTYSRTRIVREVVAYYRARLVDWYQYRGTDEAFNFFVQSRNTVPKHKLSYLFRAKNSIHDLDWEKQLDPDKEVVLIPLQYYPENTIDYWVPMDFTDYDGVLYDTVESLSKHYNVVIKEHPAMVTQRPLSFYRRLKHAGKVLFAPALEQSAIALNRADTVLTWNSSVGIEAFFSGKKVITLGKPYYWVKPMVNISKRKDISNLFRIVQKMEHPKDHDKSRLLEHLLCSTVLGDLNHIDKENVAAVARGVREMLEYEQV